MKYLLFVVLCAFSEATPGYSDSSYSGNDIGQGSGSSAGGSYSYAGSSSGAGASFPSGGFYGNIPSFVPYFQPFDFSSFFEQLNRQQQEFIKRGGGAFSYSSASSSPGSSAHAQSSIILDALSGNRLQKLAEGQAQAGSTIGVGSYAPGYQGTYQESANGGFGGGAGAGAGAGSFAGGYGSGSGIGNRAGFVGGYGGGYSGPEGTYSYGGPIGGDGAYASGSIGPSGVYQSASVYPENPSAPNVNTRFGGGSGDGGGFKSVFTSSKSVTNNVDGRPQTYRHASTTVNDNGKVTTYTAHNP